MWSLVAQRLTQITPPAATPDQLWQRVEAAWSAVPQEYIQSLFESMPRNVAVPLTVTKTLCVEIPRKGLVVDYWIDWLGPAAAATLRLTTEHDCLKGVLVSAWHPAKPNLPTLQQWCYG
ncbi:transposable element Tcb1 transposase [Trichonephila clavipes]|nr:transposable element Tcb1 transposase [Trichonephila clavipes]